MKDLVFMVCSFTEHLALIFTKTLDALGFWFQFQDEDIKDYDNWLVPNQQKEKDQQETMS